MAIQFQKDAQQLGAPVSMVTTAETTGITTNFINPPLENAKGVGVAVVFVTPAAATTTLTLRVRRNINAENVVVNSQVIAQGFTAGSLGVLMIPFSDPIPDGRAVQYSVTVQAAGTAANGTIAAGSYIEAALLSG